MPGFILGGFLDWTPDAVQVAFGSGGLFEVEFEEGASILSGNFVTTQATVTLVRDGLSAVPLPAGGLLLVTALGVTALRRCRGAA